MAFWPVVIPQKNEPSPLTKTTSGRARDFHQCVEWMGGNGHIETPRWGEGKSEPNAKKAALWRVAAFLET